MKLSFKKTKAMVSAIAVFLNLKEGDIPIKDGKVAFSEEQMKILNEGYTPEMMQKAIDAINKEIAEQPIIADATSQLKELLKEYQTAEEVAAIKAKNKDPEGSEEEPDLAAQIVELKGKIKAKEAELQEVIEKLLLDAEEDTPLERILNTNAKQMIKHSATHLYGSNKDYDAFEGRNWNQLATGKSTTATDWTASEGVNISKLNGDMELFFRENPDVITSLHRDNFGLPAHWKKKTNVVDRVTSGSISTAEISQGRKLPWAPKNKQKISAEEGIIYPISIDIEYVGHFLSEIEASWLSGYNREGSQAYKLTFVRFLVAEIDKRARLEDRVASMKGVYVKTPDDATKPGRFINRQNGLLYWLWKARDVDKKYRAFNIGLPTATNIVDYVDVFLKSLPLEVRTALGLELNLSKSWIDAYKTRYGQIHATDNNYKGPLPHPKDFENVKFVKNVDMEGSDFMFITFSSNIEILENIPKEKSLYNFEYLLRKIYIFADYKLGIRLIHIGNKIKEGDPAEFEVQTVWSNSVPIFSSDYFAPVFDDETGEISATFNQLKVDDAFATDITKITGLASGVVFKIQGNTSVDNAIKVKNGTDLLLTSDFVLSTGGILTCLVQSDGKLKELSRTTSPPEATSSGPVSFADGSLDSDEGSEFEFSGSEDVTITEILNGVQGQQLKITGNDEAKVTINNEVTISVESEAVLATATDYIELIFVDGKWTEFNRSITTA